MKSRITPKTTLTILLLGMLTSTNVFSFSLAVYSQLEEWIPFVPSPYQVELAFRKEGGMSYIELSIRFSTTGYDVSDWGALAFNANNISVNAEMWRWTGATLPIVITLSHTYDLGSLEPGQYFFTFRVWLFPVANLTFGAQIVVPDDFSTIQEAINNATEGDTIFVRNGTYYEDVFVNKTVYLVGEDKTKTIIDGNSTFSTIVSANNVTIRGFTIQNNAPFHCFVGGGIYITNSEYNNILDNIVRKNQKGINLMNSSSNIIVGNDLVENDVGFQFYNCYLGSNQVYHNNFIYNSQQVGYVDSSCSNVWDDSYPSGGNYWSNYNPSDEYNGVYQNETGGDSIGDKPYVIDANNTDRYPLIYPRGYVPSIDIVKDRIIDIYDLIMVASTFSSKPGDSNWNPYCDVVQDGVIDIYDLLVVAVNFGETYP